MKSVFPPQLNATENKIKIVKGVGTSCGEPDLAGQSGVYQRSSTAAEK